MNKNLERDLVNYLYFELNKENFFLRDEIFEYDVQFKVHEFLKYRFQNGNHTVTREKHKVDHVIENMDENRNLLNETFIELKNFIKSSERLSSKKISNYIKKLKNAHLKKFLK